MLRRRDEDAPKLTDRAAPLIEEAAERSRTSMRTRLERLRLAWRSIFQVAVSAALAYLIATEVSATRSRSSPPSRRSSRSGFTVGQRGPPGRGDRASASRSGSRSPTCWCSRSARAPAQLGVVVLLATSVAIFLGSGHAARHAGRGVGRAGGHAAAAHGRLRLLPLARRADRRRGGAARQRGRAARPPGRDGPARGAAGARGARGDPRGHRGRRSSAATRSSPRRRSCAPARSTSSARSFAEAVEVSRETTRYAPPRRRSRGMVETYADAAEHVDLAVRNVRVLARGTIRALSLEENVPPEVAEALRQLAEAVRALDGALQDPRPRRRGPRARRCSAAVEATLVLESTGNMSVSVIVGPGPLDRRRPAVGHGLELRGRHGGAARRRARGAGPGLTELTCVANVTVRRTVCPRGIGHSRRVVRLPPRRWVTRPHQRPVPKRPASGSQ